MTDQKAGLDLSGVINDVDSNLSFTSGISTTFFNLLNIDGLARGYANHANGWAAIGTDTSVVSCAKDAPLI